MNIKDRFSFIKHKLINMPHWWVHNGTLFSCSTHVDFVNKHYKEMDVPKPISKHINTEPIFLNGWTRHTFDLYRPTLYTEFDRSHLKTAINHSILIVQNHLESYINRQGIVLLEYASPSDKHHAIISMSNLITLSIEDILSLIKSDKVSFISNLV